MLAAGLPEHVVHHLTTMTGLHKQGRYDRMSEDYLKLTGEAPTSMADFVKLHVAEFTRRETDDLSCGSNRWKRSASAGSSPPSLSRKFVRLSAGGSRIRTAGPPVNGVVVPAGKGRPDHETRTISKASSAAGTDVRSAFLRQIRIGSFAGSDVIVPFGERSGLGDRVFCENFLGSLEGLVDRRFRCHPVLHHVEFGDAEHMFGSDLRDCRL
jgi:hypothetical protein